MSAVQYVLIAVALVVAGVLLAAAAIALGNNRLLLLATFGCILAAWHLVGIVLSEHIREAWDEEVRRS